MSPTTRYLLVIVLLATIFFIVAGFIFPPAVALETAASILGGALGLSLFAIPVIISAALIQNHQKKQKTIWKKTIAQALVPLGMYSILLIGYMFIFSFLFSLLPFQIDYTEIQSEVNTDPQANRNR